ncbi:toxin co-regulated pilus biosynthesis Q family protein [Cupriavidus taiwanensis]|uniref:Toxin co-regulated pilus biosynthesis protein Q C-terminal domain-containing protein n=1 Tax=Cupriavidus taiwanensis TaxID=164546 RepID=A0A7Z7JHE0_9BURK|nr:toxin co-regulated pilus biosynthesis Q family protein [Cupriavidus taiwanensis]SOZ17230.1 exported hypothetical protein [Cupriavidus taiwanensis]SOZ96442.1 exported hypothetical protein [Cupriavidus taiwanensis]SPC25613.1 exported hypothetical protein [Cupriavidus taiwanensis]
MDKKNLVAALMASGLLCSGGAIAGFINESAPAVPTPVAPTQAPANEDKPVESKQLEPTQSLGKQLSETSATAGRLVEIGTRPASVKAARGKGSAMALSDVVPAVLPTAFHADYADVSRNVPVSWSGGKPWPVVMGEVVSQLPGVVATIDWTNQTITFGMQKVRATGPVSANAVPAAARWEVRASDLTLRQSLMRWAKDAGWQVSWEVKYDFPVQLEAAFGGTFEDAVEQFTASLRTSEFPLLGCMYEGNRVVRILHYGDKKECDK